MLGTLVRLPQEVGSYSDFAHERLSFPELRETPEYERSVAYLVGMGRNRDAARKQVSLPHAL